MCGFYRLTIRRGFMMKRGWRDEGIVFCTAQPGAGIIDGIWEAARARVTDTIALVERADGRLLGYTPSSPAAWIAGGQRSGDSVTISVEGRDPIVASDPATITGIRAGSRITGTHTDSARTTGAQVPIDGGNERVI